MISVDNIPFNIDGSIYHNPADDMSRWPSKLSDVDIYVRDHRVSGVLVGDEFVDRQIPKNTDLSEIFVPKSDVEVFCLDIFPGSEDIKVYQQVLQDVASGNVILESQDKHPTDKGYIVLIVVNKARMVFRKESYKEDFPEMNK